MATEEVPGPAAALESQVDSLAERAESARARLQAFKALVVAAETQVADAKRNAKRADAAERARTTFWVVVWMALFSALGSFLFGAGDRLDAAYRWIADDVWWHYPCGLYAAMALCLGAVWMRNHHRLQYGAIECGFAMTSICAVLKSQRDAGIVTSAIIASVYLFVRGQDNIATGKKLRDERLKKEAQDAHAAVGARLGQLVDPEANELRLRAEYRAIEAEADALSSELRRLRATLAAAKEAESERRSSNRSGPAPS